MQFTQFSFSLAAYHFVASDDKRPGRNWRLWNNFRVSFECGLDRDMEARWHALKIVLDHYRAHLPDDPAKLAEHYREMRMLAHDFAVKVGHGRRRLGTEIERAFGPMPTPWWCG